MFWTEIFRPVDTEAEMKNEGNGLALIAVMRRALELELGRVWGLGVGLGRHGFEVWKVVDGNEGVSAYF